MTQAKQPEDHPAPEDTPGHPPSHNPTGVAPNGVPHEALKGDPAALPSDERLQTEEAAHPAKHKG